MPTMTQSKLRSKIFGAGIPALYSGEQTPLEQKVVKARLFALASAATWLILEASAVVDGEYKPLADVKDGDDVEDVIMFGYADLFGQGPSGGAELGYVALSELESLKFGIIPRIEFDEHFEPKLYPQCFSPEGRI